MENKLFIPNVSGNGHLKELTKFFGELTQGPAIIPASTKFVFICFTNRSGPNYLAELLASDQQIGLADETLNADAIIKSSKKKGFKSLQEYFGFLAQKIAKNNYVVIKIAPYQIEMLGKAGILDQVIDHSHFVVIERSDKLAQAISHHIAFQTKKFKSIHKGTGAVIAPEFNRERIDGITTNISNMYRNFNLFFSRNGIVPISVNYEQMIAHPKFTLSFIGSRIGLPDLKFSRKRIRLERQAGPLNQEWREKYLDRASG